MRAAIGRPAAPLLAVVCAALAAVQAYLLTLLAAAATDNRHAPRQGVARGFVILIPAHDEAAVIADTLAAIRELDGEYESIVVADACRDATASIAADAGATVWERDDPARPGKGAALEWAFDRVARERLDARAVVVIDADCRPSGNLLGAVAARMDAGAEAVQVAYLAANPGESDAAALRWAGFALMNVVRPRGKSALGLSCGLLGTGMAFRAELLRRVPWRSRGLTEDLEEHVRLAEAGVRVQFAHEASVTSPMPASRAGARVQQSRWEGGRWHLATHEGQRALAAGVRRRDAVLAHAGAELLIPPQSLLTAAAVGSASAAAAIGRRRLALGLTSVLAGQAAYVLGGLALVGAPTEVYRALAHAPALLLDKLGVYARVVRGRGPETWERTPRGERAVA